MCIRDSYETAQCGLMLAAFAKYYNYSKDDQLILKHLKKIQGIVDYFYNRRTESKKVSPDDVSYGIIRGWSEHDSCLKVDPYSLIHPFFSNNAAACRGFQDIGQVFIEIGENTSDAELVKVGRGMIGEAEEMKEDLFTSMRKSMRKNVDPPALPAVAGDTTRVFAGRVYGELMHSGILTKEFASAITRFGSDGGFKLVGRGGFRFYATGYGLLYYDWVREFLLSYYSVMAHGYSRGTWTSVEGAGIDGTARGPYCTMSQLTIPVLTKWMLVFEDPNEPVLWLAKATPRDWLEDGKRIGVDGAPTRFGTIGYEIRSDMSKGRLHGTLNLPEKGLDATIKIRLRVPGERRMKKVEVNGKTWPNFNPAGEIIVLSPGMKGRTEFRVIY